MPNDMPRDLIWKHIRAIETCMMVTHADDNIRARPMRGIVRADQNTIWFFSDTDSHKDEDLRKDPRACLTFADTKSQSFVSVSGIIGRIRDHETISDLWNAGADAYFPSGPDDPRVVLLRFNPQTGEYWDAPSSPIVLAIRFLEAKITGERPNLGTSGSAQLSEI